MSAFLFGYAVVMGIAIAVRPRLYQTFLLTAWALLALSIGLEFSTP